jgi:pilus assembly protein TadC
MTALIPVAKLSPSAATATALILAAGVTLVARRRGRPMGRLRQLASAPAPVRAPRLQRAPFVAVLAGVLVALLVSGWLGIALGALAGWVTHRALGRLEPRAARIERARAQADLPFALDLTASALRSGAPPGAAAVAVGAALGGPLGERLCRVGRALALGSAPAQAWSALADVPGGDRFAASAVRGSDSGAALARALRRLAEDLRSARIAELEAEAHRAGVLVVLPLGVCFLPAFVLGGLVPVVLSMVGHLLP